MDFPAASTFLIVLGVTAVVSALHTVTGFGFGLLAAPIYMLFFEPKPVVLLTMLLHMAVLGPLVLIPARADVDWRRLRRLLLPGLAGLPLGAWFLFWVDPHALKITVGAAIIIFTVHQLIGRSRQSWRDPHASIVLGALGGVLTTSINLNAPPVVLYLMNQGVGRERLRATTSAFLVFSQIAGFALLAPTGLASSGLLLTTLALAPACMAGYWFGCRILPAIDAALFASLVVALVFLMGLVTLAAGLGWL